MGARRRCRRASRAAASSRCSSSATRGRPASRRGRRPRCGADLGTSLDSWTRRLRGLCHLGTHRLAARTSHPPQPSGRRVSRTHRASRMHLASPSRPHPSSCSAAQVQSAACALGSDMGRYLTEARWGAPPGGREWRERVRGGVCGQLVGWEGGRGGSECEEVCAGAGWLGGRGRLPTHVHRALLFECRASSCLPARGDARGSRPLPDQVVP